MEMDHGGYEMQNDQKTGWPQKSVTMWGHDRSRTVQIISYARFRRNAPDRWWFKSALTFEFWQHDAFA